MKYALALAAVMVALVSSTTFAGEGQVAASQLADMGIPGLVVMSDDDGAEIRGQGFAYAASVSASALPGTFNVSAASALGHNGAAAVSGAGSQGELDANASIFGFPLGSVHIKVAVGSAGYAAAASN